MARSRMQVGSGEEDRDRKLTNIKTDASLETTSSSEITIRSPKINITIVITIWMIIYTDNLILMASNNKAHSIWVGFSSICAFKFQKTSMKKPSSQFIKKVQSVNEFVCGEDITSDIFICTGRVKT